LLLTPAALPAARDRDAELRTPELVDLREASRTDGASISRAESAVWSISRGGLLRHAARLLPA
jgi:hypothetical protein